VGAPRFRAVRLWAQAPDAMSAGVGVGADEPVPIRSVPLHRNQHVGGPEIPVDNHHGVVGQARPEIGRIPVLSTPVRAEGSRCQQMRPGRHQAHQTNQGIPAGPAIPAVGQPEMLAILLRVLHAQRGSADSIQGQATPARAGRALMHPMIGTVREQPRHRRLAQPVPRLRHRAARHRWFRW